MTAPRLAMVVNDPGFVLSHRIAIARAARMRGMEVHLVTPAEPAAAVAALRAEGFAHHPVPMARGRIAPLADMTIVLRLTRLFRALRPDIVHLVTSKPVLYGAEAARRAGVPAVVAAISGLGHLFSAEGARARALSAAVARLYVRALGRAEVRVIFQNAQDRAVLARHGLHPGDRAVLIPGSGVDLAAFDPGAEPVTPPEVVMAARLLHAKGVGVFAEAARRLIGGGLSARFVCYGAPDPVNPGTVGAADLARWRAEGAVDLPGPTDDIPAAFARASLVVLPSTYGEGLPKVLIEAAAAARPVITTDWPGCRDAILPGETGLLVPPRDPGALADTIAGLLADPARMRAMGAAGRRMAVERFAIEDVVARHLALYDDLLGGGLRPPP